MKRLWERLCKLLHNKESVQEEMQLEIQPEMQSEVQPSEPTEEERKILEEMEEQRRRWEEEREKELEEIRRMSNWASSETRSLEELTRDGLNQLYELVDKEMPPIGKHKEQYVTYPIPKTRHQVMLIAKSHAIEPELREFILGVCSIYSDCMHSYDEFTGTHEELKTYLLTQVNIDELVKDCRRLECSVED